MTDGENAATGVINSDCHGLREILFSSERDFLIRNNGEKVTIDNLKGKNLALYFSAFWCGPCQRVTPHLLEIYNEVCSKDEFEVVFVSSDKDNESFDEYFSSMPWVAIPFSDSDARNRLEELFEVMGVPHLVILDEYGKVLSNNGVGIIFKYGVKGYPFTPERINELKEEEERAKRNQSIKTLLVSQSRDFVISPDGNKVPVSELEGKTVGLYFSVAFYATCARFTPKLVDVYKQLKGNGVGFEIVLICPDDEEESFKESFGNMPWLALPLKDKTCEKLIRYFDLTNIPTLVIVGPDGKTILSNAVQAVEEHGVQAYPFTPEKFAEIAEIEKAREESQTLESVLVSGDLDQVIGKDGAEIKVSELVGKTILLYFSAHWCSPCHDFLPKLIEAYHKIKRKDEAFEVIFISSDRDQGSFDQFFSGMPWLALPFGDARKAFLSRIFKVKAIPVLIVLGPSGRTITKEVMDLLKIHGADAYPFTEERLKEIDAEYEKTAKRWPQKVKLDLHENHELVLTRHRIYSCDECDEDGYLWSFSCEECHFDLHPKCALREVMTELRKNKMAGDSPKERWMSDGGRLLSLTQGMGMR